jgi:hypothetical protein
MKAGSKHVLHELTSPKDLSTGFVFGLLPG